MKLSQEFHDDLCPKGKACEDQSCKILQTLRHMEQNVRTDERKYLIPLICKRCEMKQELVLDVRGDYAHRLHVGAYLHNCHAAEIHRCLMTPAIQMKED